MSGLPSGFWGPPPHWALIPLVAVGLVLGGVAARQSREGNEPVAVTVMKPVAPDSPDASLVEAIAGNGSPAADGPVKMPIEVRYGVPSPRTVRLWSEPRPD